MLEQGGSFSRTGRWAPRPRLPRNTTTTLWAKIRRPRGGSGRALPSLPTPLFLPSFRCVHKRAYGLAFEAHSTKPLETNHHQEAFHSISSPANEWRSTCYTEWHTHSSCHSECCHCSKAYVINSPPAHYQGMDILKIMSSKRKSSRNIVRA